MCVPGLDPVTLGIMAASAGVSALGANQNAQAQNDMIAEQNRQNQMAVRDVAMARDQEWDRQRAYEKEQAKSVAEALTTADPQKALLRAQAVATGPENPIVEANDFDEPHDAGIENKHIEKQTAKGTAKSLSDTQKMVQALATLAAMNSDMGMVGNKIRAEGSEISSVNTKRQGSLNANALETRYAPAEVTMADDMTGDLLMLGGQALGTFAGARAGEGKGIGEIIAPRRPGRIPRPIYSSGGLY